VQRLVSNYPMTLAVRGSGALLLPHVWHGFAHLQSFFLYTGTMMFH
jgi:hypothetical protein